MTRRRTRHLHFYTSANLDAKATKTLVSPTLGNEMNNADFHLKLTPFSNHFGVTEAGPMAGTSNNVDRRSEPGFCMALRMREKITGLVLVPCAVKVAGIPILS